MVFSLIIRKAVKIWEGQETTPVISRAKRNDRYPKIYNLKVTFCKRKVGILKKIAELGSLCNVKYCLAFTDLSNNLHLLSNNSVFQLKLDTAGLEEDQKINYMYKYEPG